MGVVCEQLPRLTCAHVRVGIDRGEAGPVAHLAAIGLVNERVAAIRDHALCTRAAPTRGISSVQMEPSCLDVLTESEQCWSVVSDAGANG
jgi:hypothetical protein